MNGLDMLSLVVDSDLNPGLAALLPAATHAAARPDGPAPPAPLPRHRRPVVHGRAAQRRAQCGHLLRGRPLPLGSSVADRRPPGELTAAVAALPAGSLGPFGPWAAGARHGRFCLKWPSAAVTTPPLGAGPLPDVPVLAISGGYDMRTPTSSAAAVIRSFPRATCWSSPPSVTASSAPTSRSAPSARSAPGSTDGTCRPPASVRRSSSRRPARIRLSTLRLGPPRRGLRSRSPEDGQGGRGAVADAGFGSGGRSPGWQSGKLTPGPASLRLDRYGIAPGRGADRAARRRRLRIPAPFKGTVDGHRREGCAREADAEEGHSHRGTLGGAHVAVSS